MNNSGEAIIRILEEQGGEGRRELENADLPDKTLALCKALEVAEAPRVREIICSMLASLTDTKSLPYLLRALDDPNTGVVAMAADAVGNTAYEQPIEESLRQRLGQRLLALAEGGPIEVRSAAVYGLGLMRFTVAFPFLVATLNDANPELRWGAAEALAHIGKPEAMSALSARLQAEPHARVRAYIETALTELGEKSQR